MLCFSSSAARGGVAVLVSDVWLSQKERHLDFVKLIPGRLCKVNVHCDGDCMSYFCAHLEAEDYSLEGKQQFTQILADAVAACEGSPVVVGDLNLNLLC